MAKWLGESRVAGIGHNGRHAPDQPKCQHNNEYVKVQASIGACIWRDGIYCSPASSASCARGGHCTSPRRPQAGTLDLADERAARQS